MAAEGYQNALFAMVVQYNGSTLWPKFFHYTLSVRTIWFST